MKSAPRPAAWCSSRRDLHGGGERSADRLGPRTADLMVDHTGLNSPMDVTLSGVGRRRRAPRRCPSTRRRWRSPSCTPAAPRRRGSSRCRTSAAPRPSPWATWSVIGAAEQRLRVRPGDCTGPDRDRAPPAPSRCASRPIAAGDRRDATVNAPRPLAVVPQRVAVRRPASPVTPRCRRRSTRATRLLPGPNGVRLAPCHDPADGNCAEAPGSDPERPPSVPDNFPSEFFYTVANSEPLTITDDCVTARPRRTCRCWRAWRVRSSTARRRPVSRSPSAGPGYPRPAAVPDHGVHVRDAVR